MKNIYQVTHTSGLLPVGWIWLHLLQETERTIPSTWSSSSSVTLSNPGVLSESMSLASSATGQECSALILKKSCSKNPFYCELIILLWYQIKTPCEFLLSGFCILLLPLKCGVHLFVIVMIVFFKLLYMKQEDENDIFRCMSVVESESCFIVNDYSRGLNK